MTTPIPGHCITVNDDAYNFYHSQVRITIECMFGNLVHRWGILRRPLSMFMLKVLSFESKRNEPATDVRFDSTGIAVELLGSGHHFTDLPHQRQPEFPALVDVIPMEAMRRQVALKGLRRPQVNKYAGKRKRN
ncbi:hypothetical protein ACHAW6_000783 [Cyclotella cf. meneghiniana]